MNGVENQLFWQPQIATKNRKPLRPNELAEWELRVAKYRIFYDIAVDDFDREIALTRQNVELMKFLDERSQEKKTFSLNEMKRQFNLP